MAKATDVSMRRQILVITECSICREQFTEPKALPCNHTFCLHCLETYGKDNDPLDNLTCPLCRKVFMIPAGGFREFPNNFFMNHFLQFNQLKSHQTEEKSVECEICSETKEAKPAKVYCIECGQNLCDICDARHKKQRLLKDHKIINLNEMPTSEELIKMAPSYCEWHPQEEIKFYCYDCNNIACFVCYVDSKHIRHECCDIKKSADKFRELLRDDITVMKTFTLKIQEGKKKLEEDRIVLANRVESLSREISKKYDQVQAVINQMQSALDLHQSHLMHELKSYQNRKLKEFETSKDEVETRFVIMESFQRYCEEMVEKGSSSVISRAAINLLAKSEELSKDQQEFICVKSPAVNLAFTPSPRLATPESTSNWIGKISLECSSQGPEDTTKNVSSKTSPVDRKVAPKEVYTSQELIVDEEMMTFIKFRRSGEFEDFWTRDLSEKACDEFAGFYQSICEDVYARPVFIPDASIERLKEKLKEEDALLWSSAVYHLICPNAKMEKALEKVQQIVAKHQAEPDHSRNTSNIIIRDESPLPSGLKVFIAEGNLVKQRVDAIVNPANSGLYHGSGAAHAIAKAAGSQLKRECERYKKDNGDLRLGEAMHTSAGLMIPQIKYVIHVVGPDARKVKDIEVCRAYVQTAFFNCLVDANSIDGVKSVAIPAISSGIYEVPVDVVADAAYSALMQFEQLYGPTRHLKEVYFVNNDQPTVNKFLDTFTRLRSGKERSRLGNKGEIVRVDQVYDRNNGSMRTDDSLQHQSDQENLQPTIGVQRADVPMGIDPANRYPDYRNMQEDESMRASQGPEDPAKDVSSKPSSVDPVETQSEAKAMLDEKAAPKEETCLICMDTITDPHTLKCKHTFCKGCIDECFKQFQPKCPSCGQLFGVLKGNQPDGHMSFNNQSYSLSGYSGYGTIEIKYSFHDGIQGDNHPNPGQRYRGTHRAAYLPDNPEGREVFGLLKLAFDARLLFTIGRSLTTGQDNVVVGNDIHQKTSPTGQYGYPDPAYLQRVKAELAAKGIVPKK